MGVIEQVKGVITDYNERTGEAVARFKYTDIPKMCKREYKEVLITLIDSRPISHAQRKSCYAMIRDIADYCGDDTSSIKEFLKLEFWRTELYQTADTLFSLSNAPMSVIAAFQKWLARFIVSHDVPTRRPVLEYVDDVNDYVYGCLISKRCFICGKNADLHHVDRVGMGRDRTDILHVGLKALPLCREHHEKAHTMPDNEFFELYHINGGIEIDKTIARIYKLKGANT